MPWAVLRTMGTAIVLAAGGVSADAADSLFPERSSLYPNSGGCSSFSRINPCGTRRAPSPVGDPTSGPLTDDLRKGPLDRKDDPLGMDAELPVVPDPIAPQTLPSQER